ncbi:MAG: S9 family peptidase [Paucibacter sp.]|nr:S9 family peptidase [Roseateles sp.]
MMKLFARGPAWLALTLLLSAPLSSQGTANPPPVADFFRAPAAQEPVPSPDGKKVATVIFATNGRGKLAVFELARPESAKVIAGFGDFDVADIHWVNDERLVFSVSDAGHALIAPIWPGLWAVDADGGNPRHLIYVNNEEASSTRTSIKSHVLPYFWTFDAEIHDGSPDVVVRHHSFDGRGQMVGTSISRLNTRTGQLKSLVEKAPEDAQYWWTGRDGRPIAAMSRTKAQTALHLIQPDGSWKQIYETSAWVNGVPHPLALDPQHQLWMIAADPEHTSDASVLLRYSLDDPEAQPQVVLGLKGYDFRGTLVTERSTGEVLGAHFETDAPSTHWFNPRMRAIQADIDAQLGGTANTIHCSTCLDAESLLVEAISDRQPPLLLRYVVATKKLSALLVSRSWIDPKQMGVREPFTIKSRDGLSMPVMITHPPGPRQAKRPAVVLVHGGPWVRGTHWADWGWHAIAQFLASRGYLVIEPEFRGSIGYGYKHYAAGFKQWGLKMQDDVSDAMDFAVAKGWADPQRVCIAGASYGGYATLMGLAKEPDRYRCGVEWVGVSDIQLMYSIHWSDAGDAYKQYGMPRLIGDLVADAQQLKDTSPVQQAARINKPLLMGYGGADRRVPMEHGQAMREALAAAGNKDVEWVVYPEEGHGWTKLENNIDFWTRVERFLARNIGENAPR